MPDGMAQEKDQANRVASYEPPEQESVQRLPARVAEIALLGGAGARSVYTYSVPDRLADTLAPGHLVQVPLRSRVMQGIALSVELGDGGAIALRDVGDVLDPLPCLTLAQIDLAQWMSAYYVCGLGDALDIMVPSGLDRETITSYIPVPVESGDHAARLSERHAAMLALLHEKGSVRAARITGRGDTRQNSAILESLVRRGLALKQTSLGRATVSERTELLVVLQPAADTARISSRAQAIVEYLRECGGEATWTDIRADLQIDKAALHQLIGRRLVLTYPRPARRDPLAHRVIPQSSAPSFTREQAEAYSPIHRSLTQADGATFLLHGITGSGKTEVYLRAVADTIAAGRQAIVLVPEIGLTPQAVERFAGRFPGQVALLHSRLSDGERYDEWQRIRRGECSVVIGPRSAIFSPFSRLGLIVIDEEHDPSYKQDNYPPRYHARDVACQLARSCGATVILGSATPDVATYWKARRGDYTLLEMTSRAHGMQANSHHPHGARPVDLTVTRKADRISYEPARHIAVGLPAVQIVDMRLELKAGNRSIFSRSLMRGLETALGRGEQAILFLNRRGNATFVNCRDCGRVVKCSHCDIPMTYHSHGDRLQCHRCDARSAIPTICVGCGSWRIRYFGLGTQKVEQEVRARFPSARVQRYDRDATLGKLGHEAILNRFADGEIDILIGTQIVAKGLDFPRVTLVGAVSADTAINMPDFRAAERTFSILTQVAGRAGRAHLPGSVVVQTYTPTHFAIVAAAAHNYVAFYKEEIRARQDGLYPPFSRLVRLTIADRVDERCRIQAEQLSVSLRAWLEVNSDTQVELIGPAPCFIHKMSDRYHWQILLRGQNPHPILQQIPRGWSIDVDPMNLL
jgi:primosomal protein N' (replication factor Y)